MQLLESMLESVSFRSGRKPAGLLLPALLPLSFLIATGLWGIDFGYHWDEVFHSDAVIRSLDRGRPLPGWYLYPSVSYWLNLAGTVPDAAHAWLSGARGPALLAAVKAAVKG